MDAIKEQAKVRLLRETADRIENKEINYNWFHCCKCNLGSILNTLNGEEPNHDLGGMSYSSHIVMCKTSGRPFHEVVQQLIAFGFTEEEMIRIELGDLDLELHLKEPETYPKQFAWSDHVENAVGHLRSIAGEIEAKVLAHQSSQDKSQATITVGVSTND